MKIWVTPDCAKKFGMLAQTKEGDKVRNYFVKAEKELRRSMQENPMAHLEYMRDVLDQQIKQGYNLQLTKQTVQEQQEQLKQHDQQLIEHGEEIDETKTQLETLKYRIEEYRNRPDANNAKFTIDQYCRMNDLSPSRGQSISGGRKLTKLSRLLAIEFNDNGSRKNEYPYWLLQALFDTVVDFDVDFAVLVKKYLQFEIEND